MGAFLLALAPLLAGFTQPLKDWFGYKVEVAKADQELKLATLKVQAEQVIAQTQADTSQLASRLGATSQEFKQGTFYPLWAIVIFSVVFPSKAEVMWHNFALMPDWFQWLFLSLYSAIWGLPFVKGGYSIATDILQSRRDYKIDKIKAVNDAAFYKVLREKIFTKGLSNEQVDAITEALKARDGE